MSKEKKKPLKIGKGKALSIGDTLLKSSQFPPTQITYANYNGQLVVSDIVIFPSTPAHWLGLQDLFFKKLLPLAMGKNE